MRSRAGGKEMAGQCTDVYCFSLPGVQTNRKTLNFSNWGRLVLPDEQKGWAHDWNRKQKVVIKAARTAPHRTYMQPPLHRNSSWLTLCPDLAPSAKGPFPWGWSMDTEHSLWGIWAAPTHGTQTGPRHQISQLKSSCWHLAEFMCMKLLGGIQRTMSAVIIQMKPCSNNHITMEV